MMKPVMTVEEARELLGPEESAQLTDEQLRQLIDDFDVLARMTIKAILRGEFKVNNLSVD